MSGVARYVASLGMDKRWIEAVSEVEMTAVL